METILEPGRNAKNYWLDLWNYRELFRVLAWRDLSIRYKQTVIGVLWAWIRPLFTMIIFTVVFGKMAKLPTEGDAPYAILVFAGMLPWTFFSTALSDASQSMVSNANLISKVYFPRMIVPSASIVVSLVDFLISFVLMLIAMAWYQIMPTWNFLALPFFVLLALLASLGPSLLFTAMNVKYRDFRFIMPFVVQFGLYISPVGFSTSVVPDSYRWLYNLNPMVGVIDGFRWCIIGSSVNLDPSSLISAIIVITIMMWLGVRQFRKMESTFADLI